MGDANAICQFDCFRRMRMLEPLVSDLLQSRVEGDFLEAGVLKGGISIYLGQLLNVAGELGRRRLWLADSFAGLPHTNYTTAFASTRNFAVPSVGRYTQGKLSGTLEDVRTNVAKFVPDGENPLPHFTRTLEIGPLPNTASRERSRRRPATYRTCGRPGRAWA